MKKSCQHFQNKKKIVEELASTRMEEMRDLSKKIDFNNLIYKCNGKTARRNVIAFQGPLSF